MLHFVPESCIQTPLPLFCDLLQARIRSLEAQLRAAQACAAVGQLRSPPPSPPTRSSPASPADSCHAGGAAAREPHPEHIQRSPPCSSSSTAGSPGPTPQQASPLPDKENQGGNWPRGDFSKRQQAGNKAAQWDEERSELLSLLERLQDQLSAHAELAASARRSSRPPQRPHATPPPSPFCQAQFAGQDAEDAEVAAAAALAPAAEAAQEAAEAGAAPCGSGEPAACMPATAQRSSRAASNLEASFDSVDGSSTASEEASAADVGAEGGSPAVAAHPVFDSPLPPESVARSGAPSPPSVRPPWSPAAEQQQGEGQTPNSRPSAAAGSLEEAAEEHGQPILRARSSAGASQTLEAFLSPPAGSSPIACAAPLSSAGMQQCAEQQRLQQAEQRAAELEVGWLLLWLARILRFNALCDAVLLVLLGLHVC